MSVVLEGAISVLSALRGESGGVERVLIRDGVKRKKSWGIIAAAEKRGVDVEFLSAEEFTALSSSKTGGGIIAIVKERIFLSPEALLDKLQDLESPAVFLIEGVEDPYNLGYAVRALYTQGINGLLLPRRDLSYSQPVTEKASTGCFSRMNIAMFGSEPEERREFIRRFKSAGFTVYAADLKKNAEISGGFRFADKPLVIIGGEKRGISKVFLDSADKFVKIPYAAPFPHALAAQTAATILAYEIFRQKRK